MNTKKKIKKGDYGYLNHQRTMELVKTLVLFAAAIGVFLIGFLNTGKKENVFTVIAILGMLPASRNLVTCIMFFRFPTGSEKVYEKVQKAVGEISVCYDTVLTTTAKSYPVNVFCCRGGNLIGYSEKGGLDCQVVEKHLKDMAKSNQLKGLNVKLFTNLNQFLTRLEEIGKLSAAEDAMDERAITLVCQLSL